MIHDHAGGIAVVCAVGLLILNATFAGASEIAYARVQHNEIAASTDAFVGMAEPAYAMAAPAALFLSKADSKRLEPKFGANAASAQAEATDETAEVPADAQPATDAEPVVSEDQALAQGAVESCAENKALQEAASAEAAIAPSDAQTVSDAPSEAPDAEPDTSQMTALPEEEPLAAHQDELPTMDPLNHAAPAAPDPSGVPPATPLPSFVKTQPSPKSEPSEAA
jgi:hypothetical protein